MKHPISLLFIAVISTITVCQGQVRDSVCIHSFTNNYDEWMGLRQMDTAQAYKYRPNSAYFKRGFFNDSMHVQYLGPGCIPETVFIGEYTTADSIHFIDFMRSERRVYKPHIHIGDVCSHHQNPNYISRNQLPLLQKLTLISPGDSFTLLEYSMTIDTSSSGFSSFKSNRAEIMDEARKCILRLKEGQMITVDGIRVTDGKRKYQLPSVYYLITP